MVYNICRNKMYANDDTQARKRMREIYCYKRLPFYVDGYDISGSCTVITYRFIV